MHRCSQPSTSVLPGQNGDSCRQDTRCPPPNATAKFFTFTVTVQSLQKMAHTKRCMQITERDLRDTCSLLEVASVRQR
jgi:hypothetical protein